MTLVTRPNFIIIGAPKAGTTALGRVLGQHPQMCDSPVKEPRFLAFDGGLPSFGGPPHNDYTDLPTVTTWSEYQALFEKASDALAVGEASTIYMYYPGDRPAERIRHYLPGVKLIAILRHPAERAWSNFVHAVQLDWEPLADFRRAWDDQPRRMDENWSYFLRYRQNGCYAEQLERYWARFPREQMRVYLYEDWCERRDEMLADMLRFLQVDDAFRPAQYPRSNVFKMPRNRQVHRLFNRSPLAERLRRGPLLLRRLTVGMVNRLNLYRPALTTDLRRQLTAEYRGEIVRLQDLLGRDLGGWL